MVDMFDENFNIEFNEEGIKFKYLSNWRDQRKDVIGQNCIKALVKVVDNNPSTITIYKNDAGNVKNVNQLQKTFKNNFEYQGWNIVDSKIINLNGISLFNIVANAKEGGKTLENNTSATINNNNIYVFELIHFKEFPYSYDDYLAILNSLEFTE